jgi:hypothetical protein
MVPRESPTQFLRPRPIISAVWSQSKKLALLLLEAVSKLGARPEF